MSGMIQLQASSTWDDCNASSAELARSAIVAGANDAAPLSAASTGSMVSSQGMMLGHSVIIVHVPPSSLRTMHQMERLWLNGSSTIAPTT